MEEEQSLTLAYQLRAIGQALMEMNVRDFELESNDPDFVVRAQTSRPAKAEERPAARPGPSERKVSPRAQPSPEPQQIELRFTRQDIKRLDQEGKSKRRESVGLPDSYTLPQVLRTIGDYLDRQERKLLRVGRRGRLVTIEYATPYGQKGSEKRTASSLYDLSARMYLRRTLW